LVRHAERELRLAGAFDKDGGYGGMLGPAVLQMVRAFADEGHSGFSASLAMSMFERVGRFEPLTPLKGGPDEWVDHGNGLFQNKRCGRVFMEGGNAYDSTGRVFRESSGACYTNFNSRVPVTFPYTPHTEYVDVKEAV
jgi:hypothetical protein